MWNYSDKMMDHFRNPRNVGKIDNPDGTATVGSFKSNAWGLYDMHGNVREWCLDWGYVNFSNGMTDPSGPSSGDGRVVLGGSFISVANHCALSYRNNRSPSYEADTLGFRLCMNPNTGK